MIKIHKRLHFLLVSMLIIALYMLLLLWYWWRIWFAVMMICFFATVAVLLLFFIFTCILPKGATFSIHRKRIVMLIIFWIIAVIFWIMDNGDKSWFCNAYDYYIRWFCNQPTTNQYIALVALPGFYVFIIAFLIERFRGNRKGKE